MKKYIYINGNQKVTAKQVIAQIHAILLTKTVAEKGVEGLAPATREKLNHLSKQYGYFFQ